MRSVLISFGLMASLTGCATVSMMPGEGTVETKLSAEQSSLRKASDAFVEQAETEKWVQPSSTLFGLARVLVDGVTGDANPDSYSEYIRATSDDPDMVYKRLVADIERAQKSLDDVTQEAQIFIAVQGHDKASLRKDVTSFETALVTAQKSRRNFAEGFNIVAERSDTGIAMVEGYLAAYDASIDEARKTADRLADLYASAPSASATS